MEDGNKRKRKPAGTPDPDAEVIYLSPKTLLESDRYVCEICNQGFQRDQNLQMHRRRHKVPWKLLKRDLTETTMRKRVFVCPEPSCMHHHPCHALGDLVGIKKHFRRKHSNLKQWVCQKCSKAYAVQSDYKAHLKTCGTRGHSCDCGKVFSRVESFIEHQDACSKGRFTRPDSQSLQLHSSGSPSSHGANIIMAKPFIMENNCNINATIQQKYHNLDLQLSIRSSAFSDKNESSTSPSERGQHEQLRVAIAEKACAEEARREAKKQIELAEREFKNAKRIRVEAKGEVERALAIKGRAMNNIASTILQITCQSCKLKFHGITS